MNVIGLLVAATLRGREGRSEGERGDNLYLFSILVSAYLVQSVSCTFINTPFVTKLVRLRLVLWQYPR